MPHRLLAPLAANFLGHTATWYKLTIIAFLVVNPILWQFSGFVTGWVLVLEFIFCLALALKCYPLQPGGLLAIEAVVLGMTSPEMVYHEAVVNFEVILLLIFMVAGIYFLKDMLLYVFSRILLNIRSKIALSLMFVGTAAFLSAFLDALTVTAVVITVAAGFYGVYHRVASGKGFDHEHDHGDDSGIGDERRADLDDFRAFLRNLMMHAAIGTALGGVTTLVGEPQNLLIAGVMNWEFVEFFVRMAPITLPVFIAGLATTVVVERFSLFGYGAQLPETVREVLLEYQLAQEQKRTAEQRMKILIQGLVAVFLVMALGFHLAHVGIIGLTVIVLATAFTGIVEEHRLGPAFHEALPFTALLVVFFAIVAVIHDQQLFKPVIEYVFTLPQSSQAPVFYLANGLLSTISDNVFVATVYINEIKVAFETGRIGLDHYEHLAVVVNAGTNILSVATPNGQAAFLFLLTSALAPLIRLSYMRMVILAFPYTITMSITGLLATIYLLPLGL